jgi:hypothetical protein
MSPMELLSSYSPFLVMTFFASIIGAIVIAAMDAPATETATAGHLASQH